MAYHSRGSDAHVARLQTEPAGDGSGHRARIRKSPFARHAIGVSGIGDNRLRSSVLEMRLVDDHARSTNFICCENTRRHTRLFRIHEREVAALQLLYPAI